MDFHNLDILVPVDFSEGCHHAVRAAIAFARMGGGSITLLHVGALPHLAAHDLAMSTAAMEAYMTYADELRDKQRHALEKLGHEEIPSGIEVKTVLRDGRPSDEILAQIEEGGHKMVFMGTHGRTGLQRLWLGSVTENVVRKSPVPVMTVR